MIFRLALFKEKEIILNMYNENRNKSYTAWDDTYPSIDNILKDIETNNLYVLEVNNEIAGSISINYENEVIDEPLFSNNKSIEFGRVVVSSKYRSKGYAKYMILKIEEEIKTRGYNNVHILVYSNSLIANNMYKSLDYNMVGTKEYSNIIFNLYEKQI